MVTATRSRPVEVHTHCPPAAPQREDHDLGVASVLKFTPLCAVLTGGPWEQIWRGRGVGGLSTGEKKLLCRPLAVQVQDIPELTPGADDYTW